MKVNLCVFAWSALFAISPCFSKTQVGNKYSIVVDPIIGQGVKYGLVKLENALKEKGACPNASVIYCR